MAKKHMEKKEVNKDFWFDLTTKELQEMSRTAGNLDSEIQKDEEAFAQVRKEWKVRIGEKKTELRKMLAALRTQREIRTVDAIEVKDFDKKEVFWLYEGKEIERREMTAEESQMAINLEKRREAAKKAEEEKTNGSAEDRLRKEATAFNEKKNATKTESRTH